MFTYRELAAKACFRELHPTNAALIMAQSGSKGEIIKYIHNNNKITLGEYV